LAKKGYLPLASDNSQIEQECANIGLLSSKLMENAAKRPLRNECLNRQVFKNGKEALTVAGAFRQGYNNYRLHNSLSYLTSVEFAKRCYEKK